MAVGCRFTLRNPRMSYRQKPFAPTIVFFDHPGAPLCFKYIFRAYQVFAVLAVSRVRCHHLAKSAWKCSMSVQSTRLPLESSDGSSAEEYRIDKGGKVEVRTLDPGGQRIGSVWCRLTPGQLSSHVERNTVVAQWLEHRLGWRRLLQACV